MLEEKVAMITGKGRQYHRCCGRQLPDIRYQEIHAGIGEQKMIDGTDEEWMM